MTQEQWARALLGRLGYKATSANVTAVLAWMRAEGGHWNNSASYNPLNTTQGMSGAHSMNSVGVKAYTSWEQGLQATVITLRNGYYGGILSAFKSGGSAQAVAQAIVGSPWGTKHIPLNGITVSGSGGGTSAYTTEAAVPQLTDSERAEQYGLSMRLINSSKELKGLFKQAVAGSWSAARFSASLKNTAWWRTQSDTLRKYVTLKITDPATWKQQVSSAGATVRALAVQVGVDPSLLTKNGHWTSFFSDVVYKKTALGWSDARLKDYLGLQVHSHGDIMYGEAGENFDKLHEIAYANGLRYSTSWYAQQAASIVGGRSTLEQSQATIRRQAAAKYSAFAEQIKAGVSAMDLAAPYIKTASDLLEMPETDVDLFNPHVAKAMTAKAAAGAQGVSMPLWQFENEVRNDPLWRKTNNARESMFGVAHQVARDFGVLF